LLELCGFCAVGLVPASLGLELQGQPSGLSLKSQELGSLARGLFPE
jgi:hypothetical protein